MGCPGDNVLSRIELPQDPDRHCNSLVVQFYHAADDLRRRFKAQGLSLFGHFSDHIGQIGLQHASDLDCYG